MRGLAQRMRARDGFKPGVSNRSRDCRSAQRGVAEPLHRFLAKPAERRIERSAVVRVKGKRVVMRNGFRLGIHEKLVSVAAARLAMQRSSPPAEILLKLFLRCGGQLPDCFDS